MKQSCYTLVMVFLCSMLWLHGTATAAHALSPNEEARISAMLDALERQTDMIFIRNGSEHSAAQAAAHLRLKLDKTRNRLESAEQFIDKVASSSSMSGKPYMVRLPGKPEETANSFLHRLLQQTAP